MIFHIPFTNEDVVRADATPVTPELYARSKHAGIEALVYFQEDYLKPLVQGLLSRSDRDRAILTTYYRTMGYVLSILRLDAPWHFQSISSAARSTMELYLDLILLTRDTTSESTERFHAFTRVERFRVATEIAKFFDANPDEKHDDIAVQRALAGDANSKAEIEALIEKWWGRDRKGKLRRPGHWSTYGDVRSRAKALGSSYEAKYVRFGYQLSWHVHSGAMGVAGIEKESFHTFVGLAHGLVIETAIDTFRIVCRELHFDRVIPDLNEKLDFLGRVPGLRLVDLRLMAQGGAQRFTFVEAGRGAPAGAG